MADLHGLISVFLGGFSVLSGMICCASPFRDDEIAMAHIVLVMVAVWTGLFGVVTRGTTIGRTYARIGLALAALAVVLGMLAMCGSF